MKIVNQGEMTLLFAFAAPTTTEQPTTPTTQPTTLAPTSKSTTEQASTTTEQQSTAATTTAEGKHNAFKIANNKEFSQQINKQSNSERRPTEFQPVVTFLSNIWWRLIRDF